MASRVLIPHLFLRPARYHSASSTWVTDRSQSPLRGPLLRSPSGRKSSWPGASASCQTPSGRKEGQPPWPGRGPCPSAPAVYADPAPPLLLVTLPHAALPSLSQEHRIPRSSSLCSAPKPLAAHRSHVHQPAACLLPPSPSKDDVERCKQKDLLEQMMAEMIGEFPDLHRTIVSERDIYLTYMLRQAARRLELPRASDGDGKVRVGTPKNIGSCAYH